MNLRVPGRPGGQAPAGDPHPNQVWRSSATRRSTLPHAGPLLLAVAVVALLTLGLHVLFH